MFGMVRIENRMREDRVLAQQACRQGRVGLSQLLVEWFEVGVDPGDQLDQPGDVGRRGFLVDGDAEYAWGDLAKIVACLAGGLVGDQRSAAQVDAQGVEEVPGEDGDSGTPQAFGKNCGEAVDARGDAAQAVRAVIDGVHAGHVGEQDLGGADIRVGFFATDVLFAGLQCHAQRLLAADINGYPDDAAGDRTLVFIPGGEECGMRTTETERDAETL